MQSFLGYFVFSKSSSNDMDLESVKAGSHRVQEVVGDFRLDQRVEQVRAQEGLPVEEDR
jgi:hypothetical protein